MTVKFRKLTETAQLPVRVNEGDAGVDLVTTRVTTEINECGELILVYHTDIAVEIPEGYVGLLLPRSSVFQKSLAQTNSVGIIDSGYRGELVVKFRSTVPTIPAVYKEGERFAQLVIVPYLTYDVEEVEELSNSERGEGGFGSTGTAHIEDIERSSNSVEDTSEQAAEPTIGSEQGE